MSDLTPKQQSFVEEYLIEMNGAKAAVRAGFSKRTAAVQASQLLAKPEIQAAIEAAKIERSERTKIDADWVLTRLAAEAQADLADLYDEHNNLLPPEEWPLIWRQGLVAGVDIEAITVGGVEVGTVKKVRFSDRIRRLEMIGKHVRVNAFQDVIQHKGLDSLADRLERAQARANVIETVAGSRFRLLRFCRAV
ncbi:terminase small subunit [Rhizobium ruizarguesonis]|uniref:terminase small subunit n=1 Tax=Rhizobium ruizarguesonis TaxID=2081791 RepID=UPI0010316936|nr:terminase small subunit [Rhizobium ruizarguesonis]TAT76024.1 terminase small subunit [Rhizobium ruizarguesonis]